MFNVKSFQFLYLRCWSKESESKPKQTHIWSGWEVLTLPQHSYSRYGCDVFVCVMINALIEPHTALIDQCFFFLQWALSGFSTLKLDIQYVH